MKFNGIAKKNDIILVLRKDCQPVISFKDELEKMVLINGYSQIEYM